MIKERYFVNLTGKKLNINMIYPANQKIMSVQFHYIFCLPFVDVVCFDNFVELIRSAADFSCA